MDAYNSSYRMQRTSVFLEAYIPLVLEIVMHVVVFFTMKLEIHVVERWQQRAGMQSFSWNNFFFHFEFFVVLVKF